MSTNKTNKVYMPPVEEVIKRLENTNKNTVIVAGRDGLGKSVVLKEYVARNEDLNNPVIDCTFSYDDLVVRGNKKVIELSYVCKALEKMVLYVTEHHNNEELREVLAFEQKLLAIRKHLNYMYFFGKYNPTDDLVKELSNNPLVLLEEFMTIVKEKLNYESVTAVIDNFDTVGNANGHFQQFVYNVLSQYVRLVITLSDEEILNSEENMNVLQEYNDIVRIEALKDVDVVKTILDSAMSSYGYAHEKIDLVLSDETIAIMISKTNGNLYDMIRTIIVLYNKIYQEELLPNEYDIFVNNYIDAEINRNPVLSGDFKLERKFQVKHS